MNLLRLNSTFVLGAALAASAQTNLTVAPDGSAQFRSVQEAIMAVPAGAATNPVVIHIKPGTYHELIYVQHEKRFFRLEGEDARTTVLTYDLYAGITNAEGKPIGTFRTPSTTIDADDFTAENLTFENSAGPHGQAVAIRIDGDRAAFRHCRFLGWQDTILANRGRHYFEDCEIAGHVDFIFGAATAFFERCHIRCLREGYITAASTPEDQRYGFVFHHAIVTGEAPDVRTYLGRPWRIHASTVFLESEMSDVVRPEGWNNWKKPEAEKTARYAEFQSRGPGARPESRVPWSKQLTPAEAQDYSAQKVLAGADGWNPAAPAAVAGILKDIEYGVACGESLRLDAQIPAGAGPFPGLLIVHGGGWGAGDKATDVSTLFEACHKAGLAWFSINYRMAPTNRWPACYEDVQTATRWLKRHAPEYRVDPNRVAILGYSAGGQLALLAAVTADAETRVRAMVGCAPPADLVADTDHRGGLSKSLQALLNRPEADAATRKLLFEMSPINHLNPGAPPCLLVQGDADKTVPYEQATAFQARLQTNGVTCDLMTLKGAPHRIVEWEKFDPNWQARVAEWIRAKL
ncbi:MAG: pectinesterase family protein [Verrucomicrobiota bacterium]